jgi:hypothetical protein
MKAIIPEDVWEEIRRHIVGQAVIRENYCITMSVDDQVLTGGDYISSTTLGYWLRAGEAQIFNAEHELDGYRTGKDSGGNLPRYVSATVGTRSYVGDELRGFLTPGGLGINLPVKFSKAGEAVWVALELREVVRFPDTFTWWMPVTTRRPEFKVARMPLNMRFEIKVCHPMPDLLKPRMAEKHWQFDGIMLPGQGFEIRTLVLPAVTQANKGG